MADTGWVLPASAVTVASGSPDFNWYYPDDVLSANDGNYARATTLGANMDSRYLDVSNFGFTIPLDNEIVGVEVRVRGRFIDNGGNIIYGIIITNDGTTGNNIFSPNHALTTSFANADRGGLSNTWGATLTPAQVNSAGFGFRLQVSLLSNKSVIDIATIWMRIYFEEPSGGGVFVRDGGIHKEGSAYINEGGIHKLAQKYVRDGGIWKS